MKTAVLTTVIIASFAIGANAMCTSNTCVNGYCTANNICTCYRRFTMDSTGRCIPTEPCTTANCVNGYCNPVTSECTCVNGYIKESNGRCVRSNGQDSFDFVRIGRGCQVTCTNGQCARLMNMQEVCYCNPGFQRDTKKANTCVRANAGEMEMERENEAKPNATSPTPAYKTIPQGRYRTVQSPDPVRPTEVVPPEDQMQKNYIGGFGSQFPSHNPAPTFETLEHRMMSYYIQLLSLSRLIEMIN